MIRHANFQLFRVHPDGLTPLRNGFLITFEKMQKQPPEVFYKKAILENFAILTGKHLCWSFFLILNIAQFLKAPIFKTSTNGCFWKCVHERRKLYIKKRIFQHQYQKQVKMYMFGYFMVGFLWSSVGFTCNVFFWCGE